MFYLKKKDR